MTNRNPKRPQAVQGSSDEEGSVNGQCELGRGTLLSIQQLHRGTEDERRGEEQQSCRQLQDGGGGSQRCA